MAFCEVSQDQSPGTPAAAGDFGFKVLTSSDPAEKTKKLQLGRGLEFFRGGRQERFCPEPTDLDMWVADGMGYVL